jgi:hypothetical protein
MRLPLTGGCTCGAARYEITQEPIDVYTCHCTDRQRATVRPELTNWPPGTRKGT